MSWSYASTGPSSNKDQVRLLIQDTDRNDQKLQDEEITQLLSMFGGVGQTAPAAARVIAARAAADVDKQVGDLRISASQRQKHYLDLARQLETSGLALAVNVKVGGISVSDKESLEDDTDRVRPSFRRGQMDNPGAGPQPGGEATSSDSEWWDET